MTENAPLTKKDFSSDQEVRWCPGCGDYAILAAVQRTLPKVGATLENTVFISGIGCSSRFPYYMNTYGFHTIHGRAPAFATGLKVVRPDLDVWVISGDGDSLSIGGNHMLHVLRRNVNLQYLLFNNQIYGLTKGQYSPTSDVGQISPSSPYGSIDQPVTPVRIALGAGARFVARGYDVSKQLPDVLEAAHRFQGASFVEILQNCPVFNDGVFDLITDRKKGPQHQLWLEHGQPMTFGKNGEMGVRLNPQTLSAEIVTLGENGITEADLLVHDETNRNIAWLIADLPDVKALGVLYREDGPVYDESVRQQVQMAEERAKGADLKSLLREGHTWTVS
ncbi:MAG: 2-oxoacid:ferredoxin oxidoreductase subunit beta [Deltaproteobacteria bacterium]|nr:2-oxoacid:ferredoxin oxidoreductase subunit beta [Deltaproteobacteria bacterium]